MFDKAAVRGIPCSRPRAKEIEGDTALLASRHWDCSEQLRDRTAWYHHQLPVVGSLKLAYLGRDEGDGAWVRQRRSSNI